MQRVRHCQWIHVWFFSWFFPKTDILNDHILRYDKGLVYNLPVPVPVHLSDVRLNGKHGAAVMANVCCPRNGKQVFRKESVIHLVPLCLRCMGRSDDGLE